MARRSQLVKDIDAAADRPQWRPKRECPHMGTELAMSNRLDHAREAVRHLRVQYRGRLLATRVAVRGGRAIRV